MLLIPLLLVFYRPLYEMLLNNHRFIYPEKSEKELRKVAKQSLGNFIRNLLFSLKMMKRKKIAKRYPVYSNGLNEMRSALQKKAVILVVPHLSVNYLPIIVLANKLKRPIIVPIRGLTSDLKFEKKIYEYLSNESVEMCLLGGAMKKIQGVVAQKGIVILAMDAILPIKHNKKIDFFGSKFAMSSGALWLAEKYSLPIFSVFSILEPEKYLRVSVQPLRLAKKINSQKNLNLIAEQIEQAIKYNPGFWNLADDYFSLAKTPLKL